MLRYLYQYIYYKVQGGPKKSLRIDLEEKCLRNSKIFFDRVFLSIYSHLFKKLELSKLCRKQVRLFLNENKWFYLLLTFSLTLPFSRKERLVKHKLFFLAKSISFEVISVLKISTFAAALIFSWPLLQFNLYLKFWN